MSWDACLHDDRGHIEGDWNYTHNCNRAVNVALEVKEGEETWWKQLDGMSGPDGASFLNRAIRAIEADWPRYEAMDPPNKWGNIRQLVGILTEMRNRVPEWPTVWSANG